MVRLSFDPFRGTDFLKVGYVRMGERTGAVTLVGSVL